MTILIRDYIVERIAAVDNELEQHSSPVITENMAQTMLDRTYFVGIGDSVNISRDNTTRDEFEILIVLKYPLYVEQITNYDDAYCKVIDLRNSLITLDNISAQEEIINVVSNGIQIENIPSDDTSVIFTISLTVTTEYEL